MRASCFSSGAFSIQKTGKLAVVFSSELGYVGLQEHVLQSRVDQIGPARDAVRHEVVDRVVCVIFVDQKEANVFVEQGRRQTEERDPFEEELDLCEAAVPA